MATIDWPTSPAFRLAAAEVTVSTPRSAWQGFYTGQRQQVAHLADRLQLVLTLAPQIDAVGKGLREAWLHELSSAGHLVRLSHPARPIPQGTMRGTPTLGAAAAAGARTVTINTTAGATLLAGDLIGIGGHLLMAGAAGGTANGAGSMSLSLALPVPAALSNGAAVLWQSPTGTFQLSGEPTLDYAPGALQGGLQLTFGQYVA